MIRSINPATGETITEYAYQTDTAVEQALRVAESAFQTWGRSAVEERAGFLTRVAVVLRERLEDLSQLATREMGKPITQSRAEVEKCAWACDFYAEHGPRFLAPRPVETGAAKCIVRHDPIGAVLGIMPWNFPYFQVFRFAAPTLMAGNVCLLRHASNVAGCALAIADVFREAEVPTGCFSTLLVPHKTVPAIMDARIVRAVTLTGSEVAGQAVAAQAGERIKKTVLELGGSDAFIVLADADLEKTTQGAVLGRTINSGQSCIAAKRFLVEESIAAEFEERFAAAMQKLIVGDPTSEETQIGPLARQDLVDALADQVTRSSDAGANVVCGGEPVGGLGCFYPPTVLTNVQPGMAAFDEETFGPVAAVTRVSDAAEAVTLANQSPYGLGGSIWTSDIDRGMQLASQLDTGSVFINEVTKSDPRVPFGGVKLSGYGRELSDFGIREFVNVKTVWAER